MAAGRGLLILLVGLFASVCQTLGQAKLVFGSEPTQGCPNEVYNPTGWTIPGLDQASSRTPGIPYSVNGARWTNAADFKDVRVATFNPKRASGALTFVSCVAGEPGRVQIKNQEINVEKITRYSKFGRVFAYEVWGGCVAIEEGHRVPLGCAVQVLFYDPDGTGKFSVIRWGGLVRTWKDKGEYMTETFVPGWVKALVAPTADPSGH